MERGLMKLCGTGTAVLVVTLVCCGQALGEKVGVTAAVNPTVTGQPPGQSMRQLKIGSDVVRNERIRATNEGSMQLIFVDRTTLTISPNSDITINEFVFNRGANSGSLSMTLGKGLVRFVGGQISHGGGATIKTPTGTMGIRGGMALINSANGKTTVVHLYGTTRISTASNSVTITRPGYYAEASGAQVSAPGPAPAGLIASYNSQLQSKAGQTGGTNRGHITSEKLRNIVSGSATGSSTSTSEQQYRSNVRTEPQPAPTPIGLAGSIGGASPGGGGGGGGGGIGGGGGPAWGLSIAPGQTGNFPGPPPGLGIKGKKP
jgi:hypothetical protein